MVTRLIRLVAAVAVLAAACSDGGSTTAPPDPPAAWAATVAASTVNVGACLDGTQSMPAEVVAAAIDALALGIRRAAPAAPAGTDAGRPEASEPVSGLHVVVRQVSANSMASVADGLVDVEIPPIDGLVDRPDPAEYETFAERIAMWDQAVEDVAAQRAEVAAAREDLLDKIAALQITADGSEIAGCVTALRDTFPVDASVITVVVSDLQQTGAPQLRGDYKSVDLLIAQFCSQATSCAQTEADFRDVFEQAGVASIETVTIAQLPETLTERLEAK